MNLKKVNKWLKLNKLAVNVDKTKSRTQNSELRILFNIIHEDCNKLVIVTIIKITVIKGKKYETKYIILFNKKKL